MIATWKAQILDPKDKNGIHDFRNRIVHYGSDPSQMGEYAQRISTVAFPFLDAFLRESAGLSLASAITPGVYRELKVAEKCCDRLKQEGENVGDYVLKTVKWQMLHTFADWRPGLMEVDKDGWITGDYGREFEMAERIRHRLASEWADAFIEKSCNICGYYPQFINVDLVTKPRQNLLVLADRCPQCGLEIDEDERFLAESHIDELTEEDIEAVSKDWGVE